MSDDFPCVQRNRLPHAAEVIICISTVSFQSSVQYDVRSDSRFLLGLKATHV